MASVSELLEAARAEIPAVDVTETMRLMAEEGAILVDVRDPNEVSASGKLAGAVNISRGMLEFRADPGTPYYNPELQPDRPVVLYCASGGRSALAGKALKDMGYERVVNLGAFKDASEAGMPIEPA